MNIINLVYACVEWIQKMLEIIQNSDIQKWVVCYSTGRTSSLNNCSIWVGLRLTMLKVYLHQYWTVVETQKKGRSSPRPCVDLIILLLYKSKQNKNPELYKNFKWQKPIGTFSEPEMDILRLWCFRQNWFGEFNLY